MLKILYQDKALVAIDKPTGWLVHRSWLDKKEPEVILQTLRDQVGQQVYPVHRLDRPTSGVLLFAFSPMEAHRLAEQFENNKIQKTYLAIVRGYITEAGEIDYPLKPLYDKIANKFSEKAKPAKSAFTVYRSLLKMELPIAVGKYKTARYSLVELTPKTGRQHQLRRHMKHLFHPIIGDTKYGDLHQNRAWSHFFDLRRLLLHAHSLQLRHPITNNFIQINAPSECELFHPEYLSEWSIAD